MNTTIDDIRKALDCHELEKNVNHYFFRHSFQLPTKTALMLPRLDQDDQIIYKSYTFEKMYQQCRVVAGSMAKELRIRPDDRILIMFPMSYETYLIMAACFHLGAVPVFIDPSMPRKVIFNAIKESRPRAVFSVAKLFHWRPLIPFLWRAKCVSLSGWSLFARNQKVLNQGPIFKGDPIPRDRDRPGLISYTTGTTGRAKASDRNIEVLMNQKLVGQELWRHQADDIEMTSFPMVVLQNLGCGITSCLPLYDYGSPEFMKADKVIEQIENQKVTRLSGTPAFMEKLCDFLLESKIELKTLKDTIVGGACVGRKLATKIQQAFRFQNNYIVYGSTEVEPISFCKVDEFLAQSDQPGLLVGQVIDVLDFKIIDPDSSETLREVESGSWGELVLSGPHVVKRYLFDHPLNKQNKLLDPQGVSWHRTGDLARLDSQGRLWLMGRTKELIKTAKICRPNYPIEERLNQVEGIEESAVISRGGKVEVYLRAREDWDQQKLDQILLESKISDYSVRIKRKFPRDPRHFSRIVRSELTPEA